MSFCSLFNCSFRKSVYTPLRGEVYGQLKAYSCDAQNLVICPCPRMYKMIKKICIKSEFKAVFSEIYNKCPDKFYPHSLLEIDPN